MCFPNAGYSIEKQIECVGLQATIMDVLMRVQMLVGNYLSTLIRPSRPRAPGLASATTWVFAENASVIRLTTADPAAGQVLDGLFVNFFRSTLYQLPMRAN